MLPSLISVLSVVLGTALAVKQSYQPSYHTDQGENDPYPIQRYIGTKQSLTGSNNGPKAMSHERDRSASPGRAIPKQSHFEPLFDDFPGPKTKQRIYYPGKGYVEMQVPVQQPDPYSDNKPKNYQSGSYDSARYNTGQYDSAKYNTGGYDSSSDGYSAPAPQRSYSPPAQSYNPRPAPSYAPAAPADYRHEDDDSPFDYLAKQKGSGGSSGYGGQASSYSSAPAPPYRAPSAPAYRPPPPPPAQPSYRPPAPKPSHSLGGYGAGSYSGGNDDGEVGLKSYNPPLPSNPSGYVPSGSYPSSYPDTKSASTYSEMSVDRDQRDPSDGLSSSFGARSLVEGPRPNPAYDAHARGFYDLAEQNGVPRQDQASPFFRK
ncbi:hypothetical protein BV898_14001 [Hypsibius exemplaris]|uniref:Uncharacterized protein n=1 Tax=Hypsibius exemplaris TaxID=2072580 RepID=A0A1W0W943_HYPEX|nr:hypothetical protein BV898_14001 [Hypsibius exemplaris]